MKKFKINYLPWVIAVFTVTTTFTSCMKEDSLVPQTESSSTASKIAKPDVPDIIAVPAGNKVLWYGYATGTQIYTCTQSLTDPTVFTWVFTAPSATLYSDQTYAQQIGIHYAGPTWESTAGSKAGKFVIGTKLQASTQDVTAIPWLLLQAVDNTDPHYNQNITYIQRLFTTGGLAPTTGADAAHVGEQVAVPYTAVYYFFGAK